MRKIWLAVVTVALLGVGYLGAQAYSSHVFERELTRALENLRANQQWQVTRDEVERGWFHSSGRLKITPVGEQAWWLSTPYVARHGLLSTRLDGALQGYLRSSEFESLQDGSQQDEKPLFGDVLDSAEPRWVTTLHTLDRRAEGRLDIPSFVVTRAKERLSSEGAEFTFNGHASDIRIKGVIAPLQLQNETTKLVAGPLRIDSRYRVAGGGDYLSQHIELVLEQLQYDARQQASITLLGLRYESDTQLDEQLSIDASIALDEARVAEESMLSGRFNARFERLNGNAIRRLQAQFATLVEEQASDFWSLSDAERKALIERLEPALLATLVDSPRFTLEGITLQSPLFGVDVRGSGELIFESDNSQTLNIDDLLNGNTQAWREHLNGGFSWQGVPPLMALQLGLSPDTRQFEMQVEQGNVLINGKPLPTLF
nr:DUF945 family protein [uncultured Halomonas sp.]